jgi:hypothetical protein
MEDYLMFRQRFLPARLIAALGAVSCLTAHAQDPAAIGSGGDPALVGSSTPVQYARPNPSSNANSVNFTMRALQQEDAVDEVEALLSELRGQMSGTNFSQARNADEANAIRLRNNAEALIRKHWDTLGPVTRDLYAANFDSNNPNDLSRRYRSPYGDNAQLEARLLGGAQDAQAAMQSLEDLLLPMLKDLKQGFDDALNQRAPRR